MPRYVALLRGINVGGHGVKMDRLRGIFEEFGFADVATFTASGNVIFRCPSDDAVALERQIEQPWSGSRRVVGAVEQSLRRHVSPHRP